MLQNFSQENTKTNESCCRVKLVDGALVTEAIRHIVSGCG